MIIKRSIFPLGKINLLFDNKLYKLKPGNVTQVEVSESKEYDVIVSLYWTETKKRLKISPNSQIEITHRLPDFFYLLGLGLMFLTFSLFITGVSSILAFSIVVILLVIPQMFISLFQTDKYFNLKVKD